MSRRTTLWKKKFKQNSNIDVLIPRKARGEGKYLIADERLRGKTMNPNTVCTEPMKAEKEARIRALANQKPVRR